ncbi:hypothetical protein [Nonomuraea dietziae]|uniref:hypothetical protein n=1 Tax=Nonomuraea dietziae TaxID=65515 RepID=UPI0031DACBEA
MTIPGTSRLCGWRRSLTPDTFSAGAGLHQRAHRRETRGGLRFTVAVQCDPPRTAAGRGSVARHDLWRASAVASVEARPAPGRRTAVPGRAASRPPPPTAFPAEPYLRDLERLGLFTTQHPGKGGTMILVTGAAGEPQGSTGRQVVDLLLERGEAVRAFVHSRRPQRPEELRKLGAEGGRRRSARDLLRTACRTSGCGGPSSPIPVTARTPGRHGRLRGGGQDGGAVELVSSRCPSMDAGPEAGHAADAPPLGVGAGSSTGGRGAVHLRAAVFFENLAVVAAAGEAGSWPFRWARGTRCLPLVARRRHVPVAGRASAARARTCRPDLPAPRADGDHLARWRTPWACATSICLPSSGSSARDGRLRRPLRRRAPVAPVGDLQVHRLGRPPALPWVTIVRPVTLEEFVRSAT